MVLLEQQEAGGVGGGYGACIWIAIDLALLQSLFHCKYDITYMAYIL